VAHRAGGSRHDVSVVSTVPTLAAPQNEDSLAGVGLLILAGEACPEPLGWRWPPAAGLQTGTDRPRPPMVHAAGRIQSAAAGHDRLAAPRLEDRDRGTVDGPATAAFSRQHRPRQATSRAARSTMTTTPALPGAIGSCIGTGERTG
jgi:hypothetical protein